MNLQHPTKGHAIANANRQIRISTGAAKRCTKSAVRYEWHMTQIEEATQELKQMGEA
jgi:hypothetical protein